MDEIISSIEKADGRIRDAFDRYLLSEEKPELTIEGYSFDDLVNKRGVNPIAAFLTLNWLIKSPEQVRISLSKGK
jgi:hypothetical protein